mmetsp:Transcript_9172/g.19979  ORF Transcript_9172/g.19979 Transcript_9172/m.19979 type:complete len:203 (+) Transcript_9172:1362-1970(+)
MHVAQHQVGGVVPLALFLCLHVRQGKLAPCHRLSTKKVGHVGDQFPSDQGGHPDILDVKYLSVVHPIGQHKAPLRQQLTERPPVLRQLHLYRPVRVLQRQAPLVNPGQPPKRQLPAGVPHQPVHGGDDEDLLVLRRCAPGIGLRRADEPRVGEGAVPEGEVPLTKHPVPPGSVREKGEILGGLAVGAGVLVVGEQRHLRVHI